MTDSLKTNQGNKSHIHHFNTYTSITETNPFPDGKRAEILFSGITTIDTPAARNWLLDATSTNLLRVTNHEFINQGKHDPRNDVLTSAKRAEERKRATYDAICAATGSILPPFALETMGGHHASTASVYLSFTKHCATRVSRRTCSWASSRRT